MVASVCNSTVSVMTNILLYIVYAIFWFSVATMAWKAKKREATVIFVLLALLNVSGLIYETFNQ